MMSEEVTQLKVLIEELNAKVDRNISCQPKTSWLKLIIGSLGVLILTVVFIGGGIWTQFKIIKENTISKPEWLDTRFKADAAYKKVFNIPDEAFRTRGGPVKSPCVWESINLK